MNQRVTGYIIGSKKSHKFSQIFPCLSHAFPMPFPCLSPSGCAEERRSFAQRVLKGVQGQLNEELLATNEEMHSIGLHLEANLP